MTNQFRAIEALSATDFSNLTDEGKLFGRILFYVAQGVEVRKAINMVLGHCAAEIIIDGLYEQLRAA